MADELMINPPYEGEIEESVLLSRVPLKLYFANILGRDSRTHEWKPSGLSKGHVELGLNRREFSWGVPHIGISFPHVTHLFRWGNPSVREQETNLYDVGLAKTLDLVDPVSKDFFRRGNAICCPLEGYILGEEIAFRARSETMEEYLNKFVSEGRPPQTHFKNPNLARDYLRFQVP